MNEQPVAGCLRSASRPLGSCRMLEPSFASVTFSVSFSRWLLLAEKARSRLQRGNVDDGDGEGRDAVA